MAKSQRVKTSKAKQSSKLLKLKNWAMGLPARVVRCLSHALIAVAVITIVASLVFLLTGKAGDLNRALDVDTAIFYSPTYHPSIHPLVMRNMLDIYYPGMFGFTVTMGVLLALFFVWVIMSALGWVGERIVKLVYSMAGKTTESTLLLSTFIIWAIAILSVWLVLNISSTINYLLAYCGLMALNLLINWLFGRFVLPVSKTTE